MNTRKDNGGKALAAWKKLGVGMIQKPLRHIVNRDSSLDEKGNRILGANALAAIGFANKGNGLAVQNMALSMK